MLAHPLQPRLVAEQFCLSTGPCSDHGGKQTDQHDTGRGDGRGRRAPRGASLNIRERAALYAAYMPFLKGGGIFIPTSRQYQLGEEVFMLLSLMDDPNRIAVQGKVVWITPEGSRATGHRESASNLPGRYRRQRATTIEQILGETLASVRPTHTM